MTFGDERSPSALVEVGWLLLGDLDDVDWRAIVQARERVLFELEEALPQFRWSMSLVDKRDLDQPTAVEPSALLELGVHERDDGKRDFVFVVTPSDLVGMRGQACRVASSRALGVAVVSTARIDPWATGERDHTARRTATLASRLSAQCLHALGDMVGIPHRPDGACYMSVPETVGGLDDMVGFDDESRRALGRELVAVADARLEEEQGRPRHRVVFYVLAIARNLGTIGHAVARIRPWLFPVRLGRLTAAAVSAALILTTTAEAWDLAANNDMTTIAALALATLIATSGYLIRRQALILGRGILTEQMVVSRASVVSAVVLGLGTTFGLLLVATYGFATLMFSRAVIDSWLTTGIDIAPWRASLHLSMMVATLGLLTGAMGASFERHHHIRHVAYIDEEL